MADRVNGYWGWARRWPRYMGIILLASAAQCGLGAWAVSGDTDGAPLVSYLAGSAATAGIIGLVLCLVPLPIGRSGPPARRTGSS